MSVLRCGIRRLISDRCAGRPSVGHLERLVHNWTGMLSHALATWASFYSNSAPTRTAVAFAHVAGLLISGGAAILLDWVVLSARREDATTRAVHLHLLARVHRVVFLGLGIVIASGVLLLVADVDTYWSSRMFWTKMGMVVLLLGNGWWLAQSGRAVEAGTSPRAWQQLRVSAILSITLWLATTLAGASLPNV